MSRSQRWKLGGAARLVRKSRLCAVYLWVVSASVAFSAFINFETAPVHPVALSPDGRILAVCNLLDARVELFDVSSGVPVSVGEVRVGVTRCRCAFARRTSCGW